MQASGSNLAVPLFPGCFRGNSGGWSYAQGRLGSKAQESGGWHFDKQKVCALVNKPGQEVLRSSQPPSLCYLRLEGLTGLTLLPGKACQSWVRVERQHLGKVHLHTVEKDMAQSL